MTYHIAGIDPGKSGGFAIFDRRVRRLITAGPLLFDDPGDLHKELAYYDVREILLERAQSAPGQGNGFEYGRGFGRTEAACLMTPAKLYYVAPVWWKSRLSVPVDKGEAIAKALSLIPGLEKHVTLKKHDGIAEAALIGSILLNRKLTDEVYANNEKRLKPKKKRVSFRL